MYNPTKPYNRIIQEQAERTRNTRHLDVTTEGFIHRKFPVSVTEMDHTDGIGTKGLFHWQCRTYRNAALDAMAMNINDLQMYRMTPYKMQNHIFLPEEREDAISAIATALADECVARRIAMTGGECAIHDNAHGMEISITMSGFCDRNGQQPWTNRFSIGDLLVGLSSSGLHANGFSFVRRMMDEHGSGKLPFRDHWLTPTRIYDVSDVPVKGIQHITGGAFTKLVRQGVNIYIHRNHSLKPQDTFQDIYHCCYDDPTMYRTFNCGIGMVLSVHPTNVDAVMRKIGGEIIGEVKPGDGEVTVESMFSTKNFKWKK